MSSSEQPSQPIAVEVESWIDVFSILAPVWQRRKFIVIATGCGFIAGLVIAMLIPKEYQSTARLMPPDPQTMSGSPMLSPLGAGLGALASNMSGGFLSTRTGGQTAIGILTSTTVEDDIIKKFDLKDVYHSKYDVDARAKLEERTATEEAIKSGIVTITVTDRNPVRAREIVQAYVDDLSHLVDTLSTSSARRERIFLEGRLNTINADLKTDSTALSHFSSKTATIDPQRQGEATVEAAAKLQADLIAAESELSESRAVYTNDNVRVRAAKARVDELQTQLSKLTGKSQISDSGDDGGALPSVRQLPLLGATYADLYRKVATDESLYKLLTTQYELARVQEAEGIPPVKVLDAPQVPEKKSSPRRLIIVFFGMVISFFGAILWILATKYWPLIPRFLADLDQRGHR